MDGDEDMQAVHSNKSVAAMLSQAKEKIASVALSSAQALEQRSGAAVEPKALKIAHMPVIVTHEPGEGSKLEAKNAINKLPYMHRNPAV